MKRPVVNDGTDTFDAFMAKYVDGKDRVALDLDVTGAERGEELTSMIIIRSGDKVAVLNVLPFSDYIDIDVHSFVDGERARASVFGMDEGRRLTFDKDAVQGTSQGWPGAAMLVVLVGRQD